MGLHLNICLSFSSLPRTIAACQDAIARACGRTADSLWSLLEDRTQVRAG
jgi:hypothetical protein